MNHLRPLRVLGTLLAATLTLGLSAAPASAARAAKPSPAPAVQGDAGTRSLPAGAARCPSTPAKSSSPFAACGRGTGATSPASVETTALPAGSTPCPASSATAACTRGAAAAPIGFAVSIAASQVALAPGGTTTLTATANQDVASSGFLLEIFDETTGAGLVFCSAGATCSTSVTQTGSALHSYVAAIAGSSPTFPPPNAQATSTSLFVSWMTVSLVATSAALPPNGTTTLMATMSLDLGPTPFFVQMQDITARTDLANCGSGTTCSVSVTQTSTARTYVAYVAGGGIAFPPADIRAQSAAVVVSWISVTLTTSAVTIPRGSAATVTASASLDVSFTPFWIQVYDLTSNTRIALCGGGATCSTSVSQPAPALHAYIAFVARNGILPPPDVRAGSSTVFVNWT